MRADRRTYIQSYEHAHCNISHLSQGMWSLFSTVSVYLLTANTFYIPFLLTTVIHLHLGPSFERNVYAYMNKNTQCKIFLGDIPGSPCEKRRSLRHLLPTRHCMGRVHLGLDISTANGMRTRSTERRCHCFCSCSCSCSCLCSCSVLALLCITWLYRP